MTEEFKTLKLHLIIIKSDMNFSRHNYYFTGATKLEVQNILNV